MGAYRLVLIVLSVAFAALSTVPVRASDTVLTLVNPRLPGKFGTITLTRENLLAMEQHVVETGNIYIDGVAAFRGPRAFDVIDIMGRAGARQALFTTATDEFIEIELEELRRFGAILALEKDGEPLTLRTRGPLWLIYPLDDFTELKNPIYRNRLKWHVQTIELR